jgi:GAF domain-containing protein
MADAELIRHTFVELADTLVEGYDLIEFLHALAGRGLDLLGMSEAGIVLADARGDLQVLASSSERMRLVELLEVQRAGGPCADAFQTGEPVRAHDLAAERHRWPEFSAAALEQGFRSVYALPMRLRDVRIGAFNLFADEPHGLAADDETLGQAMADVATIGILQERMLREHQELAEQLSQALQTRIVLEQAKGVLAEQGGIEIDAAFEYLRGHARRHNLKLASVARRVVDRELSFADLGRAGR